MTQKQNGTLDSIFADFEADISEKPQSTQRQSITIWIPEEYKAKYELLQGKTRQRFGKKLKEVVKMSIDKIYEEAI